MFVQIFASSACTGVVCTIGAPNDAEQLRDDLAGARADAADDAGQRVDLLQEAPGGDPLGRVRDEHVLADLESRGAWPGSRPRTRSCPARPSSAGSASARARARPSRSSSAERMSRMSISMCENDGVPSVITMWRALRGVGDALGAATAGRSRARGRAAPGRRSPRTASARRARRRGARGRCRSRPPSGRGRRTTAPAAARRGRGRRRRRRRCSARCVIEARG